MKNNFLLIIATAALLACASDPPPRYTPDPQPAPPPVEPEPAAPPVEPEPAPEPASPQGDGPWRVSLISVRTLEKAARLNQMFAAKGYRVEIEQVEIEGTLWQRLVFPGLGTRQEAELFLSGLEQEFAIEGGWIPLPAN